jgi:hypothetical protein
MRPMLRLASPDKLGLTWLCESAAAAGGASALRFAWLANVIDMLAIGSRCLCFESI